MSKHLFTVVCDYAGGTYVSQFEGNDPADIAYQWAAMVRSEQPIPEASVQIANSLVRMLDDGGPPTALKSLTNVWQSGAQIEQSFFTATFVRSA